MVKHKTWETKYYLTLTRHLWNQREEETGRCSLSLAPPFTSHSTLELDFRNKEKPLQWEAWALQTQLHAVQPQVERTGSQQQRPSINKPKKLWKGNRILTNLLKYIWFIFNVPKMTKYTLIGEGNGHRLQFSCLENPIDRGAWQATVHGVPKSLTWLSHRTTTSSHSRVSAEKQP